MRYFVQPFDIFGESNESQLSPEYYMKMFAKVSHIKDHITRGMHFKGDHSKVTREGYKEYAKTYHGSGTSTVSIAVTPKEVVVEYEIFYNLLWRTSRTSLQKELNFKYDRACELKIWLTTEDIFKLYGI